MLVLNMLYDRNTLIFTHSEPLMSKLLEIIHYGLMEFPLLPLESLLELITKNCLINYIFVNLLVIKKKNEDKKFLLDQAEKNHTKIVCRLSPLMPSLYLRALYCNKITKRSRDAMQKNLCPKKDSLDQNYDSETKCKTDIKITKCTQAE